MFLEKGYQLTGAIHADEPVFDFALDLAVFWADAQTGPVAVSYTHLTLPTSDLV